MSDASDQNTPEAVRLRAAHQLLDERPSPRVRAAVLRAAAQVRERSEPSTARASRERSSHTWLRWRPTAAATVTVAVLAIGVALNVDRQTSVGSRIEPPAAPAPAASAPPQLQRLAPARQQEPVGQAKHSDAVPAGTLGGLARDRKPVGEAAPSVTAPAPAEAAPPVQEFMRKKVDQAKSTAAAPPPKASITGPASSLPAAAAQSADQLTGAPQEKERRFAAPAPALAAPPPAGRVIDGKPAADEVQSTRARAKDKREAAVRSPDEWLARIIELRRAGRNAEADDELARFRTAFPDATIPPDALGATSPQNR